MAAKKKKGAKKKKKAPPLLTMTEEGECVDGSKQRIYRGHIGGREIGAVVARNKTEGRRKLVRAVRALIK